MITSWFKQLTQRWLVKRIPPNAKVTLDRHNIFIMPSAFGACYGVCCLLLFLLGTNYQNNLIILFSLLMVSIFITSMLLSFNNLSGLSLQRLGQQEIFSQQAMAIQCQLQSSTSRYGVALQLGAKPSLINELSQQHNVDLSINSLPRGVHSLGRITISSAYPLGLYRCWSHVDLAMELMIFPAPLAGSSLLFSKDDRGERNTNIVIGRGDNFHGLEQYQRGESLKRVAWKQVAQGRGMLTKQFSHGVSESQWLDFSQVEGQHTEQKLSHLCSLVIELSKQNRAFGLKLPHDKLDIGQGEGHRLAALTLLANYHE